MAKRKNQALIHSDSDGSASDSGSDLENDLSALAKKTKSEGQENERSNTKNAKAMDSATTESDDDWAAKPGKSKKKKHPSKRTKRKATKSSSEASGSDGEPSKVSASEEGEVSDSGPSGSEEFNDGYDDDLMGDAEDRTRLAEMTEKEREQEIYKRVEQREAMKKRFEIEKKLRMARQQEQRKQNDSEKKEKNQDERKYERAPDPKERSKDRKKTIEEKQDKKSNAMALLKARREERREREEKEKARIEQQKAQSKDDEEELDDDHKGGSQRKLKASDVYSDDSGSSDTEREEEAPKTTSARRSSISDSRDSDSDVDKKSVTLSKTKLKKPLYVNTRDELNKIFVSRSNMAKFVHLPFFDKAVQGCFVRIGIGNNRGNNVYRVGEIINVSEIGQPYDLENTRTNKVVMLRHATDKKVYRLKYISDREFTDSEFSMWQKSCERGGISMPTSDEIGRKVKDITEAKEYRFPEGKDFEKMLEEKKRFKPTPYNFAMKKAELMRERDVANSRGDDTKASELNLELSELEEKASWLDKRRTDSISSISYINNRNRKRNIEGAEKAIKEELKANKGKTVDDPFTRRSTKPRMVYKPEQKESVIDGPIADESSGNILGDVIPKDKENVPEMPSKQTSEDLFNAHNFDITIDLVVPIPSNPVNVLPKSVSHVKDSGPRRSLNLQDYKKKRGLI